MLDRSPLACRLPASRHFLTAFALLLIFSLVPRAQDLLLADQEEEVIDTRPSRDKDFQLYLVILEQVFFADHEQSPDCRLSIEDLRDESHYLQNNVTAESETHLDPFLNISAFVSDPVTRFLRHCPVSVEHQLVGYRDHWDQFSNATLGQATESFMFGILVQSLEMRKSLLRIQIYDEEGDTTGIIKELVSFLRLIILFDNIYAPDGTLAEGTSRADPFAFTIDDEVEPEEGESPPGSSTDPVDPYEEYNAKPYRAAVSLIYRFADFFSVQALTYRCASVVNEVEFATINLLELESKNFTQVSVHLSDVLVHSHPLVQSCGFAWLQELTMSETYIKFSSRRNFLLTLQRWVLEDERVFSNLLEVHALLNGQLEHLLAQSKQETADIAIEPAPTALMTLDYSKLGFYLGDSLGRMILSLGDD